MAQVPSSVTTSVEVPAAKQTDQGLTIPSFCVTISTVFFPFSLKCNTGWLFQEFACYSEQNTVVQWAKTLDCAIPLHLKSSVNIFAVFIFVPRATIFTCYQHSFLSLVTLTLDFTFCTIFLRALSGLESGREKSQSTWRQFFKRMEWNVPITRTVNAFINGFAFHCCLGCQIWTCDCPSVRLSRFFLSTL